LEKSELVTETKLKSQNLEKRYDQLLKKVLQLKTNAKQLEKLYHLGTGKYDNKTYVTVFENRVRAAKVLHKKFTDPGQPITEVIAKFEKNVVMLSELHNPNLVKFIAISEIENQPVFITELIQTNLFNYIKEKEGSLSLDLQIQLCTGVFQGLEALHEHSLIHGHLHDRIVLIQDDQAKISDFYYPLLELKKDDFSETKRYSFYMAPEILNNQSSPSFSSDVFSVGALILQVASGTAPLLEDFEKALADLSSDHILLELITHCLNKDSQSRPSVEKMCKKLEKAEKSSILTLAVSSVSTLYNHCIHFSYVILQIGNLRELNIVIENSPTVQTCAVPKKPW